MSPHACADCVSVHGDDPSKWLNAYPQGAEWRKKYSAHLCDGCADERDEIGRVEEREEFGWVEEQ